MAKRRTTSRGASQSLWPTPVCCPISTTTIVWRSVAHLTLVSLHVLPDSLLSLFLQVLPYPHPIPSALPTTPSDDVRGRTIRNDTADTIAEHYTPEQFFRLLLPPTVGFFTHWDFYNYQRTKIGIWLKGTIELRKFMGLCTKRLLWGILRVS